MEDMKSEKKRANLENAQLNNYNNIAGQIITPRTAQRATLSATQQIPNHDQAQQNATAEV